LYFNSLHFAAFFTIVFAVAYLLRKRVTPRNAFLLVASYYFYGCWDWRFLSLILVSTAVDYACGRALNVERVDPDNPPKPTTRRRLLLLASLATNLGLLGVFKYFGFFYESAVALLESVGWLGDIDNEREILRIVLPVGISFYTFQTLSYTIDLYRGRITTERNLLNFALFVAFFPQLVAGPIERAAHLLPQIGRTTTISAWHIHTGAYLIGWGLFKKVVLADNAALVADNVFDAFLDPANLPENAGFAAYLGVLAFAIQIYCDFSGYTDIARGSARMMGFDLMRNFNLPYFARNPSDFWRRWHISLSTWLRDYLYIPLGGNRQAPRWSGLHALLPVLLLGWILGWPLWINIIVSMVYVGYLVIHRGVYNNLMMTMLLGGLWHGAAWTFVLWGLYHGLLLAGHRGASPWLKRWFTHERALARKAWTLLSVLLFFQLTLGGWLLFRAQSVQQVWEMLASIATDWSWRTELLGDNGWVIVAATGGTLLIVQLVQYFSEDPAVVFRLPAPVRGVVYAAFMLGFVLFGEFGETPFIYFQF